MSYIRPALRKHNSSPGTSATSSPPSTFPTPSPSLTLSPPPPLQTRQSTGHISIQLPERSSQSPQPRSRPNSGSFTPDQLHSAMHRSSLSHGSASPNLGGGTGIGMSRTSTQGSAGEGKYRRKVGFEAFEAGPATLFAYTCQAKSEGYKRSRSTRVFACAVSPDEAGQDALDWLMTELVEDGDEVVAIRVIELAEGERTDPNAQDEFREDAHQLLTTILDKNNEADDRRISVIVEFVAGKVTEMLLKMIALYRPDSASPVDSRPALILSTGSRHARHPLKAANMGSSLRRMGSVSRFAVSHSPVPVIVVRPERKVKQTLQKRQADPKRGQYAALVGPNGLELSRSRSRERSVGGLSDRE